MSTQAPVSLEEQGKPPVAEADATPPEASASERHEALSSELAEARTALAKIEDVPSAIRTTVRKMLESTIKALDDQRSKLTRKVARETESLTAEARKALADKARSMFGLKPDTWAVGIVAESKAQAAMLTAEATAALREALDAIGPGLVVNIRPVSKAGNRESRTSTSTLPETPFRAETLDAPKLREGAKAGTVGGHRLARESDIGMLSVTAVKSDSVHGSYAAYLNRLVHYVQDGQPREAAFSRYNGLPDTGQRSGKQICEALQADGSVRFTHAD